MKKMFNFEFLKKKIEVSTPNFHQLLTSPKISIAERIKVHRCSISCHKYIKLLMGVAGPIFELHPPNFQKMCIFWRCTNDISTIFCYLLWFQFWKKCQSLPLHPRVVPVLAHAVFFGDFFWKVLFKWCRPSYAFQYRAL